MVGVDEEAMTDHPSSPAITLHGHPLNSPARHRPDQAKKRFLSDVSKRKDSFQRAVDVSKLTLENTRLNSGFKSIEIVKEIVRVDDTRPPSPSSFFSKGAKPSKQLGQECVYDGGDGKAIKFVQKPVVFWSQETPFYDVEFPLKSVLKKPKDGIDWQRGEKEKVIVKKIVYRDDVDVVHVTDLQSHLSGEDEHQDKAKHGKAGEKKRLGAARRIVK